MEPIRLDSEQTIVAIATPAGLPCWRTIVRLSGPDCLGLGGEVFRAAEPLAGPGFRAVAGEVELDQSVRLAATAYRFRGPRSYTGQDMLELHLPGSTALAGRVVDRLVAAGARPAEPGEFTLRAVLNGRIDLTGAEAVGELIAARGDAQLRAAFQLADGTLARRVGSICDALADLLADVEAALDLADEPITFISTDQARQRLSAPAGAIGELRAQAGSIESLEQAPTVALVGRPNAGKSTLMNRLTGLERALCSPLPGTTRDVLSAPMTLADGEAMLLDSAGLDESAAGAGRPALDRLAQDAARRAARYADLLVLLLDPTVATEPQLAMLEWPELAGRPVLVAVNKCDLGGRRDPVGPPEALRLSALTGQGVESLRAAINRRIFAAARHADEGVMLNARHRAALAEAQAALGRAGRLLDQPDALETAGELVAQELRDALDPLGQISGRVVAEDILARIFSRFCVGK